MVRRRRRGASAAAAHDRRTSDLPHGADVASSVEEDPYAPGDRIVVLRSIRDDPLAGLRSRGHIDQAQFQAGRRWQACHERAGTAEGNGHGPNQGAGGRPWPEPGDITDVSWMRPKQLRCGQRGAGARGDRLVNGVLGEGLSN